MNYLQVQNIAKTTMAYARQSIKPGMRLTEVRRLCETKMRALGADSFWYWNIGALVFSGDETAQSVSGRKYKTSDRIIEPNDIITIDLSPQVGNIWGDYARTVILQDGEVVKTENVKNSEWKQGLQTEDFLHKALCAFATPQTTFEEVYFHMNCLIEEKGFVNLDFKGNLGHSIARRKRDRIYIEKGNASRLGDAAYFTFEPHISVKGSPYGYKKENIYYFDNGKITEL